MVQILVIADDLSGAADCAVACKAAGFETHVITRADQCSGGAHAVSVDVNSRAKSPDEAGAAVAEAVRALLASQTDILYQKMDSTLRGNWAVETVHARQAASEILGYAPLAIVAPAFPGARRATVDGHVLVDGVPLEETEIWQHAAGTGAGDLRASLDAAGLRVASASLDQIAQGPEALATRFEGWRAAGYAAVVCDARSTGDLLAIAGASRKLREKPLLVGSAGLMRALVGAEQSSFHLSAMAALRSVTRPVLTVVGSASSTSREQFDALVDMKGIASLVVPPAVLRMGCTPGLMQCYRGALDAALASGSDMAVMIGRDDLDLQEGPRLATGLATLIAPRLYDVGGLILTGGETARAILERAGISGLRMLGEVEPGVPVGLSIGSVAIPVITKAGAFGSRETLIRCYAALRDRRSGPAGANAN